MRSPGCTLHPSREICRAKTSSAGAERKSPDCSTAVSSDTISSRMPVSGPHVRARKSARRPAGCSTRLGEELSRRCQRSVGMDGGQRSEEPGPRECPVRVDRAGRNPERFRRLFDRRARQRSEAPRPGPCAGPPGRASGAPRRRQAGRRRARSPGRRSPSRGTRTAFGPPRRSARRRRAISTSTRRIIRAETPKKCPRFCQGTGSQPSRRRHSSLTSAVA